MTNLVNTSDQTTVTVDAGPWTKVANESAVPVDRGIAAVVGKEPVAVFRLAPMVAEPGSDADPAETWYAVSHIDPIAGVPVMARGLVGSHMTDSGVCPTVASPLHKRRYDLRTGACIDGESPGLATFEIIVADGWVLVR